MVIPDNWNSKSTSQVQQKYNPKPTAEYRNPETGEIAFVRPSPNYETKSGYTVSFCSECNRVSIEANSYSKALDILESILESTTEYNSVIVAAQEFRDTTDN